MTWSLAALPLEVHGPQRMIGWECERGVLSFDVKFMASSASW